jgi:membrane-bound lytic murein transglycosylase A
MRINQNTCNNNNCNISFILNWASKAIVYFFAAMLIGLYGCTSKPIISDKTPIPSVDDHPIDVPPINYQTQWKHIDGWASDNITQVWQAWLKNCGKIQNKAEWYGVCQKAYAIDAKDMQKQREYFETYFAPKELNMTDGINRITGYYQPVLQGSRVAQGKYIYPIYAYPSTWKINKPSPMPTRAQLSQMNMLKGFELLYLDNPIDAAFLQVQGSGQIILNDGELVRVSYAGNNEHTFKSFAQWLVDKKYMTRAQASIAGIKSWAMANPQLVNDMLNSNPRFIFFTETKINSADNNTGGAIGALGLALTPERSIAVDPNYIPLGAPVFLVTAHPNGGYIKHLVMAQDTGNAIKGSIRADFFWGSGEQAGVWAGKTNYSGKMWLLMPK